MIVKFHAREKVVAVVRLITCWEGSVTGKGQRCFRVIRKKSGTHRCHAICEEIHVRCSVVRGEGAAAGGREK